MNRTTLWLAAMCFLFPLGAQDPAAPPVDATTRLKQLNAEQQDIHKTWRQDRQDAAKAAEKAKAAGKPIPAIPMRPDLSGLRAKYFAAARDFTGDDAVKFLVPALQVSSSPEQYSEVIDVLLDKHLDSAEFGKLGNMLPHLGRMVSEDYAAAVIAKIEKHGKNLPLMGWLAFSKYEKTFRSQPAASKAFIDAKAIVATALDKAGDKGLQRQFDSLITEQEDFGIGLVSPDIVGTDLDGVDFKLSDYKGKVVFLDFWGDW